ncbi:trans isomerase A [Seminavis robusta]|uniref:peptidylprolyl isomerase n=1 Tax=Seminavis robusta TaxID=568900 RepID=A0A9N8HA64_9STRA|nr:trans isomerase A [Seminavis robusta]|eukprot:Sro282_g107420.1 trans isomerase A (263) ;mRNA; r:12930-13820
MIKRPTTTRRLLFLCLGLLSPGTCAFAPSAPSTTTRTSTELSAFGRRQVFRGLRRVVFAGTAASVFQREAALAEAAPTTGRIVEIEFANVDGSSTQSGKVKVQMRPEWAPRGAARFEELTMSGFWNNCKIFRVLPGFVAQFGIHGDTEVQAQWRSNAIPDDPVRVSNRRGTVVFATNGPNTRTSQVFINTRDEGNAFLDRQGFAPFGEVIEGMDIVDKFYSQYGEGEPDGNGPNQGLMQQKGDAYLKRFPKLTYIRDAKFLS